MPLGDAIAKFVAPEMHLNFASTPSRSNASIRELARRFRGTDPQFTLSATGFHSTAHLLALLRLGRRYISCFFGDNYPTPRPNPLYQTLRNEGAELEHWSLLTYVLALRAAATGEPYALTHSLVGTTLAAELGRLGKYYELPDPSCSDKSLSLIRAIQPDITFIHAAAGTQSGLLLFAPPYSEGFHGALAARRGVIATVDRIIDEVSARSMPDLLPLPRHRVIAVCEAPFGAHPQPVHFKYSSTDWGYVDDEKHYQLWRHLSQDEKAFEDFSRQVLEHPDDKSYSEYVGADRLQALRSELRAKTAYPPSGPLNRSKGESPPDSSNTPISERTIASSSWSELSKSEILAILGSRALVDEVSHGERASILAGIGVSFNAARLARLVLEHRQQEVELMVETGFTGVRVKLSVGRNGITFVELNSLDGFLLSAKNIAAAERLTSVEAVLGTLVTGSTNRCVGIIGAAQVAPEGALNSTQADGQLLVGSGGANDIAAGARAVVVLTRFARLVPELEYVTSTGKRVRHVITELGMLSRTTGSDSSWLLTSVDPCLEPTLLERLRSAGWGHVCPDGEPLEQPTQLELLFLDSLRSLAERKPETAEVHYARS